MSKEYVRDSTTGKIIDLTYEQFVDKVSTEKNILIQISLNTCYSCQIAREEEEKYIKNHNITIYSYTLDKNEIAYEKKLDFIYNEFSDFNVVPVIYWIENKTVKHALLLDEKNPLKSLDDFIIEYEIDSCKN